jgi:hypothetical protein
VTQERSIVVEFGEPMELVSLMKICSEKTYRKALKRKNMSDAFLVLYHYCDMPLGYGIRKPQGNLGRLALNGVHQLSVCRDDINLLGRNINIIKRNAEDDAEKIKGVCISSHWNAGEMNNTE